MSARLFPIQGAPSIPWAVIAPCEAQALRNHDGQTLERLAERRGLSPCEAVAVLEGRPWFRMEDATARLRLLTIARERFYLPEIDRLEAALRDQVAAHAARVDDLLDANNRSLTLRRALEEEVAYWRRDALARLRTGIDLHKHAVTHGNDDRAADIAVGTIFPTLAALENAAAKEFHSGCELCGKELRDDAPYRHVNIDGGTQRVHVRCGDPAEPECGPDSFDPAGAMAEARAIRSA